MSFKVTAISNPGTATQFGADDLDLHAKLLNGQVAGIPPVKIKSSNKWGFWDGIMYIRNQSDTWDTTIRGQSNNAGANLDLSLPPITANDTLVALGLQNIFLAAQKMDAGTLYKDQSAPATPAAGYGHFYYESGHLKKKNSSGVVIDYDNVMTNIPSQYDSESINIWNPAQTFTYSLKTSAILANRKAIFPVLTADDTFAFLGIENIFTEIQRIRVNDTGPLEVARDSNTVNDEWGMDLEAKDSLGNYTEYARVRGKIIANTDGAESGSLLLFTRNAGTMQEVARITETGVLRCGGVNRRIQFDETGLTGSRTYTFPDVTTQLAGLSASNIFLQDQEIQENVAQLLTLYRPSNTINNGIEIWFTGQDSASNKQNYSRLRSVIIDNTDTSEDAAFRIQNIIAGSVTTVAEFTETGDFIFGANQRAKLLQTNMTALRSFFMPNVSVFGSGFAISSGAVSDLSNTSAEQNLVSVTIPANSLNLNGFARVVLSGYILQNQATGTTYTFRVKFGGTTMWADVSASIAQSATKLPVRIEFEVYNKNSTSAQGCSGKIMINDTTAATTGLGDIADDEQNSNANFDSEGADTSISTTSDQTLLLTVQMSVANSATHFVRKHYSVEMVTAT